MKQKQSGFSLIELAIVLVIIGLLLGGVLKGQELINSAKAKNMIADFKNAQIFIYGYLDRYRALPGDDIAANVHVAAANNGDGDGIIEGGWNDAAADGGGTEAVLFWEHVRLAGLWTGSAGGLPTNSAGGRIGVQSNTQATPITGMTGAYVACSQNITGNIVTQIDANLDDGLSNTGSVQATAGTNAAGNTAVAPANIGAGTLYTVCMTF